MQALTLSGTTGIGALEVREVPAPALRETSDVRIRVHAASINRLDVMLTDGLPGVTLSFPHIVGTDAAGVVESVGADVQELHPGDRVMVNPGISCGHCESCLAGEQPLCSHFGILGEHRPGTAAEFIVVPASNVARVPDDMGWAEAAAFSLATLTAWRMLVTRAQLRAGETVLVWGAGGGLAQAAIAISRLAGASVIAASTSDAKLDIARRLGADHVVNHTTTDLAAEVKRITGRRGADVVVDSVGEATWTKSLGALGRAGRLVTCGGTSGPMVETDVRRLFWNQWTIMGTTMGNDAEFDAITAELRDGRLLPPIDSVHPLADARAAFERLASGEQFGKVVIRIEE